MDLVVLIIAAVLVAGAQGLIILTTRPRPHGVLEYLWLTLPAVGVVVLLLIAFSRVIE